MRGEGWECDACGNMSIVECAYPPYSYDTTRTQPVGWLAVVGPIEDNKFHLVDYKHFCCWNCVQDYAYIQAQQVVSGEVSEKVVNGEV